jgi:hypothetical protein
MIRSCLQRLTRCSWTLALLAGVGAFAFNGTPSFTPATNLNAGSVIPGAASGSLVLTAASGGTGTRTVTGGTILGGSPIVTLGSFTLSGKPGDAFTVTASGIPGLVLSGPSGRHITVTSLNFATPFSGGAGSFPPGGTQTTTTPTIYLGATLAVGTGSSLVTGSYIGNLTLTVHDTVNGRSATGSLALTVAVDPTPITLVNLTTLNFGDVFANATGGSVVVTPAGVRTATGGLILGSIGPVGAATFTVGGANSSTYAITLPSSTTLASADGSTMVVNAFTSAPASTGLLNSTGTQLLSVGATMTVNPNQEDGNYYGTFPITVSYN